MRCKKDNSRLNNNKTSKQKRNTFFNLAYINYQKAFDFIPYSWLIKSLKIYIVELLKTVIIQ